jgi:hypothetical protein
MINNKNIINIVESKRSGAQIPFTYSLPPDRYDRTPSADPKMDRTLLLLENQKRDYDLFKTDLIKAQMNNIKTITDTINNTPNADIERLKSLAMKYLPNEFEDQPAGVPQQREPYEWVEDEKQIDSDDESLKTEPQKIPEPKPVKSTKKPKQVIRYTCDTCGKGFNNKQGLESHKRAHKRQEDKNNL